MTPYKAKTKQVSIYIILLACVVIAMALLGRNKPDTAKVYAQKDKTDTLNVAVIYGPLSYYIYGDTLGGLNYDLLRRFEKETQSPLKFYPIADLTEAMENVEKGKYQILASLPSNYELKKRFLTSESMFLDRLVLIQKRDENGNIKIKSALDIGEDTIYIPSGSPALNRLHNLSKEIGSPIAISEQDGMTDEYLAIKTGAGEIKYAVISEKIATAMGEKYEDLSYDNPISFTQFQVWIMNRGDSALLTKINNWITDFRETDDYRQLIRKY